MSYRTFRFKSYAFDQASKELRLTYSYDEELEFHETYLFNFEFVQYDVTALDRACQLLFFMAGISYYKLYLAPNITIDKGQLDQTTADFLTATYQNGLGEFFYVNKLDPRSPIPFTANSPEQAPLPVAGQGALVGIGGGKDSLVTIERLRQLPSTVTWSLDHQSQLKPLVKTIGLPHYWVERTWDPAVLEHNKQGAYNGHVPISAIFAAVGTVVSILSGKRDAIVSNENSANEPTLHYQDLAINHQYSKSLEFEKNYQKLLQHNFGDSLHYYSFLRRLSEVHIAEIFAQHDFEKYKSVFSSCNRAFTHDSHAMFWCGHCPKCAFVFLALTPFVSREDLEKLFHGKNLLLTPELEPLYRQLLGIEGDKPLECVGEIKESRAAMRLAQQIYPELSTYQFEIPDSYDYRGLAVDALPSLYADLLKPLTT